jgi:hypothetical protein
MGSGMCTISESRVYLNSQYGEKKTKFLSLKDKQSSGCRKSLTDSGAMVGHYTALRNVNRAQRENAVWHFESAPYC